MTKTIMMLLLRWLFVDIHWTIKIVLLRRTWHHKKLSNWSLEVAAHSMSKQGTLLNALAREWSWAWHIFFSFFISIPNFITTLQFGLRSWLPVKITSIKSPNQIREKQSQLKFQKTRKIFFILKGFRNRVLNKQPLFQFPLV